MLNFNLVEAFVNRFLVIDLRLKGAPQDDEEPQTFSHPLSSSKIREWIKVMKEEMGSMKTNQVWDLVDLMSG